MANSILRQIASKIYRSFYPLSKVEMYKKMGVKIGEGCKFQFDVVIDFSHFWLVEIGNNVTLAPRVHILAHDASTKVHLGYTRIARVKIEDNVFIGAGSIILPGVTIGKNSIVGAGSLVKKNIPPDSVFAGNPAKFICDLETFLKKKREEFENFSKFDDSYTLRANVSQEKKQEMINKLQTQPGFVV